MQPLRSCSILREPESIAHLCNKLRDTFASVQRALDETPDDFTIDWSETKRTWYAKHWQVISSLDRSALTATSHVSCAHSLGPSFIRNLNMFYLLAHQVEDRPPRIHRLAPILDKLSTYQAKFADLARRIAVRYLPSLALRTICLTDSDILSSISSRTRSSASSACATNSPSPTRPRGIRLTSSVTA